MNAFLHVIMALGGLAAAAAVAGMCLVGLFVWIGGAGLEEPTEAWRHADKS